MESNILKLSFDGAKLFALEGENNIEWVSGSTSYPVSIAVTDSAYDYFHIILTDSANKKVLEMDIGTLEIDEYDAAFYRGNFLVPGVLQDKTRINIGVTAKRNNDSQLVVSSAPFPITIRSGIGQPNIDLLDEETQYNFSQLLNFVQAGLVLKQIFLEDRLNSNGQPEKQLGIRYYQNSETSKVTYLGRVNSDLIDLGAQIIRINNQGGGGKIGALSALTDSQQGFAGGYDASAGAGAAIGKGAKAKTGVAIGYQAKSEVQDGGTYAGIAIGQEAHVDSKSASSIAIGDYSKITQSRRSIVIGGATLNDKSSTIKSSERTIGIGYNTQATSMVDGIIIGTEAIGQAGSTNKSQNAIAIGPQARAALHGAIAIGQGAKTAFDGNALNIVAGNITDENNSRGFGGIAIGQEAYSRRSASIALGKKSEAHRWGAVAIGTQAQAGSTDSEAGLNSNSDYTKEKDNTGKYGFCAVSIGALTKAYGSRSVAIGYHADAFDHSSVAIGAGAQARNIGAIQLGNGDNTVAYSLRFRDRHIVIENALQIDFNKDSIKNKLSISNGGTGADSVLSAQRNLGIQSGNFNIVIKDSSVYEGNIKFPKAFSSTPNVVLTIKDTSTSVPYRFTAMLDSCSNTEFRYKVQMGPDYNGKNFKGSNTISVYWIAVGT